MQQDQVLEAYLREKRGALVLITLTALIVLGACLYFRIDWSIDALFVPFIATIWFMYRLHAKSVRNGSFGRSREGRAAIERWLAKRGARRAENMHLPG